MTAEKQKIGIGIIGCGAISQAYFTGAKTFDLLELVSCADLNLDVAKAKAEENNCKAESVGELLKNPNVDLVVNLTIPAAHAEVSMSILEAGKHAYGEKPFTVNLAEGKAVLERAKQKGLRIGCAPDTFLGAGLQTCRKLIDDGWLGEVRSGTAFMLSHGPESWHPNPIFYYQQGGGPMFDMGPYYITALTHLLGPVKAVRAITSRAHDVRIATCKEHFGEKLQVDVPTHYSGLLEFHSGAVITVTMSFDVYAHGHSPIEIYGTEGSLKAPDPNTFGGPVNLYTAAGKEWQPQSFSHPYTENMRGIGVADMAYSILSGRPHRASGDLAYHILDVMHAFEKANEAGVSVQIESQPDQPAAFPLGLIEGQLDV